MNLFLIIGGTLVFLAAFFLMTSYLCFNFTCRRKLSRDPIFRGDLRLSRYVPYENELQSYIDTYNALEKETVCISSAEGLRLVASYVPPKKELKKLVIAFHGYRSCALTDLSPALCELYSHGCALLVPDQRSHGRSEGKYIGFGVLERGDCKAWCEYARERFGEEVEIYLYGVSMGAATVLMSAELGLSRSVKGIAADCGFTTPWRIIKRRLWRKYKIPVYPMIYFMNYWSRNLAEFDFRDASVTESVRKSEIPILILHGSEDTYVPLDMSRENCAAKAGCRLVVLEGADHARSSLHAHGQYTDELLKFMGIERQDI